MYLYDLVNDYLPCQALRSGDKVILGCTKNKAITAERVFSVAGPTIWNYLPLILRV